MSVVRALTHPDDAVLSNHRNHGHFLTYSGDFVGLVAEIMGRERGVCRGIGGSQHLAYRHFHSNGVQAGMTAIGTGLAWARQQRDSRGIVATFIGDGTLGQGLVYESLNIAATRKLPVLFVVENNGIAQTTPTADTTGGSIEARGAAFGIRTWRCDDADPEFVTEIEDIVNTVRSTGQPGFLVIDTRRLGPHSKGDDLRETAEMEAIHRRDPLSRLGDTLSANERTAIEEANLRFLSEVRNVAEASPESRFRSRPKHIFHRPEAPAHRIRRRGNKTRHQRSLSIKRSAAGDAAQESGRDCARRRFARSVRRSVQSDHRPFHGIPWPRDLHSHQRSRNCRLGDRTRFSWLSAGCRDHVRRLRDAGDGSDLQSCGEVSGMFDGVSVPLVIRTPSGGRRGYGPTHSQSPENLMAGVPGLTVLFPSPRHDSGQLLTRATIDWPYPTVFFEHKLLYGAMQDPAGYTALPSDAADPGAALFPTLSRGGADADLTIVAYGGMLPVVEKVALELKDEEIEVADYCAIVAIAASATYAAGRAL